VNLAGFYYLAAAFGGIEVCIQPAPASAEPSGMKAGTNLTDADPLTGTDNPASALTTMATTTRHSACSTSPPTCAG
jgi:hypothetical protein